MTSSLRKQGPIRRVLKMGCGVWVPGHALDDAEVD
jgi:hypothetical protein